MIEVLGVSKRFGGTLAVDALDLRVARGERVALVGHSGCGKTTIVRLIAGLEIPDAGEIRIGGALASTPTHSITPHERGLGYVPQSGALFPTMSVRANVSYGLYGLERRARAERTQDVLAAFGLTALADRAPHELSGGQARRVALARALAPAPARLLLDEPLTNLDLHARTELLDEIDRAVRESAASLIYVTHEPAEAMRLGARIVEIAG